MSKEGEMDIDTVLNEYRTADDGKRLSLFLEYRELRDLFEQIEQQSTHEDFVIALPWRWWSKRHHHRLAHAA
jgi:hypothetical protein